MSGDTGDGSDGSGSCELGPPAEPLSRGAFQPARLVVVVLPVELTSTLVMAPPAVAVVVTVSVEPSALLTCCVESTTGPFAVQI